MMVYKLAIVVSHPTQYYSPWFRMLAADSKLNLKVFYLWDFGVTFRHDRSFNQSIAWDIPLLDGYEHEFVPNISSDPGTHHFNGLNNPKLRIRIKSFGPDAVLLFGHGWRTMVEFLLLKKTLRIPVLFRGDSHLLGRRHLGFRNWLKRSVMLRLFRQCDAFLAVGKANADYFRFHGVNDSRIYFAPHCVDNDRFRSCEIDSNQLRQHLKISADHRVVLFAGKFESKKQPLELMDAFLKADVPKTVLVVAGAGVLEGALRQRADGDPRIRFLPFQNQSKMPELYSLADLFVLFSYGSGETWGLSVNEAMNCGCGIILSSHVGCASDLVHPGENGLIVEAGNKTELTRAIEAALTDDARLESWKKRGREIISSYSYAAAKEGLHQALGAVYPLSGDRLPKSLVVR